MYEKKTYHFKVLWSQTYIGIAININENTPLTTYYFWPREDGWALLKKELDSKPWIVETSKIEILNGYTVLINYWIKNSNKRLNILNKKKSFFNFEILGINSNSIT
jgi:30S ribosomal protein 3